MGKLDFHSIVTTLFGCAAVAAIAATMMMIGGPRVAQATPAYAAKEGKACGYCHVNAAGGGPRNDVGKKYEANGHKF